MESKDDVSKRQRMVQEEDIITYLRSLKSIRDRCYAIFHLGREGKLPNFRVHLDKLPDAVNYVHNLMQKRFPGGFKDVPFHARFRHFEVGGIDRIEKLRKLWESVDKTEQARRFLDLVVVSVLLDAGAGPKWSYKEPSSGQDFNRSEGLAVASLDLFLSGAFSSDPAHPHQADAKGLQAFTVEKLREGFQVNDDTNPLVGLEGRAQLLQRLGKALEIGRKYFISSLNSTLRPGNMVDYLMAQQKPDRKLPVETLWEVVIKGFEATWPASRTHIGETPMGDVWRHNSLPSSAVLESYGGSASDPSTVAHTQLVPFHKLSQWLTYSLMEPLAEANIEIEGVNRMTGLPEYRNGGFLIDIGILEPKRPEILTEAWDAGSEVIVEWRALIIPLLDKIAEGMRQKLGATADELPLVKVLECGTWAAGRAIAAEKRSGGGPPIQIKSDGTVF